MRLHVTIEHLADGKSVVLYAGDSVVAATEAQLKSVADGKAIRTDRFFNPAPVAIRYPDAERRAIALRARQAQDALQADLARKAKEAEAKRSQAKQLTAEAKRLEGELATANAS